MIFFYVRHGDPIYDPDSLTPLGERQAEAVAKRLALYGVDRVYSSTSNRAMLTAKPTCELVKKEMELLDFANESHAYAEFTVERNGKLNWVFCDDESVRRFLEPDVISLGYDWYEHPEFTGFKKGMERVYGNVRELFLSLGYEHIERTGRYKVMKQNDERVALFAHGGFGAAFLSAVLDIPYPLFSSHFDICHTGVTAIEFEEDNGYAVPKVLTLSSDSHLYRDGLPTKYNNRLYL